jgi:D-alanyl-D-alanine carboxypeptidase/D-alanyl-D-alanine-endopeptidase (penicillin-binding protein 4)
MSTLTPGTRRPARAPARHLTASARRSALLALLLAALVPLSAPHSSAQDAPRAAAPLDRTLNALVARAALGERIGLSVVDARTGRVLFGHHADLALNPASNEKLITAATALTSLGADFRMLTGVYGTIEGDAVVGGLYLKGAGDPTLRLADFVELAEALVDRGVRRIDEVVVDGTYFDERFLPPAFEQQPNEVAAFRAPVSALAVDGNAYELRVVPGATEGAPATVRLDASGYFELTNEVTTTAAGEPRVIADQRGSGEKMTLRVRGTVPLGIRGVSYRRRVENPVPFAGHAFVEALRRLGIRTPMRVRVAATPPSAAMITSHRSPPLFQILTALGKDSDNFVAEMVLKVVAAERRRPGRTAEGAAAAIALLERAGVPHGAATIVNGSGLFDGNLVAASHFTKLLSHVYRDPALRSEYLAHLAIGGVDGTLRNRLRDVPRGVVRAKTGTLGDAITLSGYVLGPADEALAFSVITNGVRGKHGPARALCDDTVRALVAQLHSAYAVPSAPAAAAGDDEGD